jgi:hypothetical protein
MAVVGNTGKTGNINSAFPNALLGLCYFHVVILGIAKNVANFVAKDGAYI